MDTLKIGMRVKSKSGNFAGVGTVAEAGIPRPYDGKACAEVIKPGGEHSIIITEDSLREAS